MKTISTLISDFITFINGTLVPLVFAVAFIFFLYGVARYFIAGAANPEQRKNGVQIIMYSIIGFAVMMSIWGLVNLLKNSFGLDSNSRPCLPTFGKDANCDESSGTQTTNGNTAPQNLLPSNTSSEPNQPGTNLPGIY